MVTAVEAQAFATPTLVAAGTAAGEITRGAVVPQDDPAAAAGELERLLSDESAWRRASEEALLNAQRFHWPQCSAPLIETMRCLQGVPR